MAPADPASADEPSPKAVALLIRASVLANLDRTGEALADLDALDALGDVVSPDLRADADDLRAQLA